MIVGVHRVNMVPLTASLINLAQWCMYMCESVCFFAETGSITILSLLFLSLQPLHLQQERLSRPEKAKCL
jgi:hypothetical protein